MLQKISQDTWGLSIACTDIFGIKMYLKHAQNGVIGIDATSVGTHEGKQIYWLVFYSDFFKLLISLRYAITVDMKGFERTDAKKHGMIRELSLISMPKTT